MPNIQKKKSYKTLGLFATMFLFMVGISSSAQAVPDYAFIPTPKICKKPTSVQAKWLTAEWAEFLPFVRVCPIVDKRKRPVLMIVSISADLYYLDKPSGTVDVSMPKPLLFLPQGQLVGTLPMNYPDDPPNQLVATFTNWQRGFPQRIDLLVKSPNPSGDQIIPSLVWNNVTSSYERRQ